MQTSTKSPLSRYFLQFLLQVIKTRSVLLNPSTNPHLVYLDSIPNHQIAMISTYFTPLNNIFHHSLSSSSCFYSPIISPNVYLCGPNIVILAKVNTPNQTLFRLLLCFCSLDVSLLFVLSSKLFRQCIRFQPKLVIAKKKDSSIPEFSSFITQYPTTFSRKPFLEPFHLK